MEVELNSGDSEKFFEQIQKLTYSKFQRKLIYNISKNLFDEGTHYIVRSLDLTFIITFGNHIQILLYMIVFMVGFMLGIYPKLKLQKVQYYSSIIGIILVITYIIKQFEYIIVAKAFFNGIMNCQLTTLRAQLLGDNDSKLFQISNYITSFFCGCSLLYMDKRVVFSLQIFIFIICIARSTYQPPLLGQIDVEDLDAYFMYLEKCTNENTLIIYDDFKNTVPNRTFQSFSFRGKIPGFKDYFQKLIYTQHKQFKFLLSQLLYGFIFYRQLKNQTSNLIHLKFYLQDRGEFILYGIILQNFVTLLNIPLNQSVVLDSIVLILSVIRLIGLSDKRTMIASSVLSFIFLKPRKISETYQVQVMASFLRIVGGVFLAYLLDDIQEIIYIQIIVVQLIYLIL